MHQFYQNKGAVKNDRFLKKQGLKKWWMILTLTWVAAENVTAQTTSYWQLSTVGRYSLCRQPSTVANRLTRWGLIKWESIVSANNQDQNCWLIQAVASPMVTVANAPECIGNASSGCNDSSNLVRLYIQPNCLGIGLDAWLTATHLYPNQPQRFTMLPKGILLHPSIVAQLQLFDGIACRGFWIPEGIYPCTIKDGLVWIQLLFSTP